MSQQPPNLVQFSSKWMGFVGGFLAISVTMIVCAQTLIPYFYVIPADNSATIGQQQTMFQTVFLMVVSFFFGASMGSSRKDETIAAQANAAAKLADTAQIVASAQLRPVIPNPDETRYQAAVRLYGIDSPEAKAETPP